MSVELTPDEHVLRSLLTNQGSYEPRSRLPRRRSENRHGGDLDLHAPLGEELVQAREED